MQPFPDIFPADVCKDQVGNFLVIDSHNPRYTVPSRSKGKILRIIMSAEDGLSGVDRIAMKSLI